MIWRAERPTAPTRRTVRNSPLPVRSGVQAGAATGRQTIGLAEDAGPFERLLLEILHAVGWRGEQRRLFEVMPHLDPIASFTMLRTVLARLDVSLIRIVRKVGSLSPGDFPCLVVDGEKNCRLITTSPSGPRVYDLATQAMSSGLGALRGTVYLVRTDKAEESPSAQSAEPFVGQVLRALKRPLMRVAALSALISLLGIALSLYVLVV
ncbi:MAG: hypothetical protein WDN31_06225 [Hyphomicrobium sp.]